MKKQFLATILCLCMALTLLPTAVFATGQSSIQLGASGIGTNDKVYFGKYTESSTAYDVPWIVLSTGSGSASLLSEYMLGKSKFRLTGDSGYYNGSMLNTQMDELYNAGTKTLFTSNERGAIAAKTNLSCVDGTSDDTNSPVVPTAYLYPLSSNEAAALSSPSNIATLRSDPNSQYAPSWWLRSSSNAAKVFIVDFSGRSSLGDVDSSKGVRPAFNFDLSNVLFSSAAVAGKSATGMDAGLTAVPAATPTEWKLTLLAADRSGFSITTTALTTSAATVNYTGAQTGTNEYISAMIVVNDQITYYGRIKSLAAASDANGTVTINIPSGVTLSATTQLKVFNEQHNDDRTSSSITDASRAYTDYASEPKIVTTPVPSAAIGNATVSGTTGTAITATDVTVTLSNEKFNVLAAGADVSTWFNLPAGLTAKIKADVAQDATSATVTVSGTPTATSTAEMTVTIPAANLVGNGALTANANTGAKWAIVAPVATPTFSPAAGTYNAAQSVTLACATAGASIYYTTDGTPPTNGSTPYSGAISVSQDTTIKAIAIKTGMADSAVASADYSIIPLTVSGSSNFVEKTANGDAVFTIGAGIANFTATKNFQSATLDGIALDLGTVGTPGTDGSIEDGSIILKINSTKLNNLSVGSHTLVVTLKDGSYAGKTVSSTITVTAAGGGTTPAGSTSPSTGDTSGLSIWVVLATLSGTGAALLAGTCIKKRKAAAKTK